MTRKLPPRLPGVVPVPYNPARTVPPLPIGDASESDWGAWDDTISLRDDLDQLGVIFDHDAET